MSRYSSKTPGLFIERDGDLENRVITMPLPQARLWVRNLMAMYAKRGYAATWSAKDGSAIEVDMGGWTRTFEAVAL